MGNLWVMAVHCARAARGRNAASIANLANRRIYHLKSIPLFIALHTIPLRWEGALAKLQNPEPCACGMVHLSLIRFQELLRIARELAAKRTLHFCDQPVLGDGLSRFVVLNRLGWNHQLCCKILLREAFRLSIRIAALAHTRARTLSGIDLSIKAVQIQAPKHAYRPGLREGNTELPGRGGELHGCV